MSQLKNLSIEGFRRLRKVNIDFTGRPFAVLLGANGTGKTSFLEAIQLLGTSARGRFEDAFESYGGIDSVASKNGDSIISFGIEFEPENDPTLQYSYSIRPRGIGYSIFEEKLTQKRNPNSSQPLFLINSQNGVIKYFDKITNHLEEPTWEYSHFETALSQVPKMFAEPERFRETLQTTQYLRSPNTETESPIRRPQAMRMANHPGFNGGEIVSFLYMLRESNEDRFSLIQDELRTVFDDFDKLAFPPVANGTISLKWKLRDGSEFNPHQLSDGILRFLWYISILNMPKLPAIMLLDEPELSMHPRMLSSLVEVLREASLKTQIIVATHSETMVRHLKPSELLMCDSTDEEGSTFSWADNVDDIENWLKDYSLDQLWAMNIFGGRN